MAGAPFMGRLLFCAKKICWKVHCLKRQNSLLRWYLAVVATAWETVV